MRPWLRRPRVEGSSVGLLLPHNRRSLLGVGAVLLATSLVSFSRIPLLPDIDQAFSLSPAELSVITASFALGRLAADFPAGLAVDRFPVHRVLTVVGAFLSAGSILLATAPSLTQVLAGVFLVGVASAAANTAGMVEFSAHSAPSTRGRSMAAFTIVLLSGQAFGPLFGGILGEVAGWRTAQAGCAAIGACVVAGCLLWRTERSDHATPTPKRAGPRRRGKTGLGWTERLILGASRFVVFLGISALLHTFIPVIGGNDLGLSTAAIGVALAVGGVSRFAGASIVGIVSDRVSRKAALVPSLAIMGIGAALLAAPPSVTVWGISIALLAVGSAGISAAAAMVGDRVAAKHLGTEMSGFRFLGDIGMLVGPILVGWVYGQAGRVPAMLVVSMALIACATVATAALRDPYSVRP